MLLLLLVLLKLFCGLLFDLKMLKSLLRRKVDISVGSRIVISIIGIKCIIYIFFSIILG